MSTTLPLYAVMSRSQPCFVCRTRFHSAATEAHAPIEPFRGQDEWSPHSWLVATEVQD